MRTIPIALTLAWLTVGVFTVGCNNGGTLATPTGPTAAVTTENFSGTVSAGGNDWHPFTTTLSNGQVNAILTAAGPPATIFMGLGIGTVSGTTCTLISGASVLTQAGSAAQLSGTANAGAYCVMVYDAGNQTADVTYSVTVNHY
jgi:hypothetical protein